MNTHQKYSLETMVSGWTRIDMLIALYDRSIANIRSAQLAKETNDTQLMTNKLIEANKFILALHSGLNTEEEPIAANIARLLNFVMLRLEEHNFEEAIRFLQKLQTSFEQIREEATVLEKSGSIPPLNSARELNTVV